MTFLGALGLLFIALKLLGIIAWSWWLVTLPLWGTLALALLILIVVGLGFGAAGIAALSKLK